MEPKTEKLDRWLTGFFIAKQAEGISPNTVIEYRKDFAYLARWCQERRKTDLAALSAADLKEFLAYLRTEPTERRKALSPKTIRNVWVALRSFYGWLAAETGKPSPMLAVPSPKFTSRVIEPLSRDEIARILKACDTKSPAKTDRRNSFVMKRDTALRDRAILLMLLDAGLRATELCNLAIRDVDLPTGRITVRQGKGGKDRISYLGKLGRRVLWRYLNERTEARPDEPLFITREGHSLDSDRLEKLLRLMGERAGVPNVHPHRLRHTFATEFLRNGGNLLGLQRLLGHSSLEMVRRYAAIVEADLARAHETGSPADRWRL